MAIKEITTRQIGKKKSGWRFDKKRELWVTFAVDTTFDGARHVRRGFLTSKAAEDYLKQLKIQERLKQIGVVSLVKYPKVCDLFQTRLKDIENKSEKGRAERVFKKFLSLVSRDATIEKITKNDYKRFADLRLAELNKKHSDASRLEGHKKTVNREINPIAKAFSSVKDYYNLPKWTRPDVFKFPVSRTGRTRLIEPAEYNLLLDYFLGAKTKELKPEAYKARRRTGLVLQMALMTGLRHGEICAMEKRKLNRQRREIDVYRFKTKRWKIYSPLTDTMLHLFDEGARLYPDGDYFFSERGLLQAGFYTQMEKVCSSLGIVYGKFKSGGFILHDARHTFSTILHQNLIDDKTSIEFTDNPTAISLYQHSTNESKKRAMQIIEKQFGSEAHKPDEKKLKRLFDDVRNNRVKYADFRKTLESFYGFLTKDIENDVADVADVIDENFGFVQ